MATKYNEAYFTNRRKENERAEQAKRDRDKRVARFQERWKTDDAGKAYWNGRPRSLSTPAAPRRSESSHHTILCPKTLARYRQYLAGLAPVVRMEPTVPKRRRRR